jgi:hypothetical protein
VGLPDHFVGLEEERWRDREAEGLGGLKVDDQLERGRLLDGRVGWLGRKQALPSHCLVYWEKAVGAQGPRSAR